MSLPKLVVPEYTLTLPSTGETVRFRPFVMKEQKIFLIAMESNDDVEMISALKQIAQSCILTKSIDINTLPEFDLEYILLKLRCKSVGEEMTFNLKCPHCKEATKVVVNGDEIEVTRTPEHTNKVELTDDIGIIMKYPTIEVTRKLYGNESAAINKTLDYIVDCIDSIWDAEEVYTVKDHSREELEEFVNDLNREQFNKVMDFFNTSPILKHTIEWKCSNEQCGKDNELKLEGVDDFFI